MSSIGNRSSRSVVKGRASTAATTAAVAAAGKNGPSPHGRLPSYNFSGGLSLGAFDRLRLFVTVNRNHSATMNCLPVIHEISLFSR